MLEFMVCGQRQQTNAFPVDEVTAAMLESTPIRSHVEVEYVAELVSPLEEMGRRNLADILKRKLWLFQTEHTLGLNHLRPIAKELLVRK